MSPYRSELVAGLLAGAALLSGGCADRDPDAFHVGAAIAPLRSAVDVRFDAACAALRDSRFVTLYVGLPREAGDDARAVVRENGQRFDPEPRLASDDDVRALQAALARHDAYGLRDPDEAKLCRGFHADYALTWLATGGVCSLQICFGCGEADLYTPDGRVTLDLREPDTLREQLAIVAHAPTPR